MTTEHIRCAFEDCQAGGVILPGAPAVATVDRWCSRLWFHPGCWAAEQRRREAA